jgi:tripartite-type tricarboxylate transporter receptor subunit TctC
VARPAEHQAGKLRALAITSNPRSPLLPDVPTMDELGYKGVTVYSWQAVALPKGTPADIKARLHQGIVATLSDPQIRQPLLDLGFEIGRSPPSSSPPSRPPSSRDGRR